MQRRYLVIGFTAVLALSLALPAVGAPSPLSIAKKALKTSKKADKRSKRALRLAQSPGPQGPQGRPGANGKNGTNGTNGTNGAPGLARSYGLIANNGTTVAGAVGVQSAKNGTGEYCLKVPFTPQSVVATTATSSPSNTVVREVRAGVGGFGSCGTTFLPGTNAFVTIRRADTGAQIDTDFFVMIN